MAAPWSPSNDPRPASPRACSSSTTAAAPTSATCSGWPTRSTRSGGCGSSRRAAPLACPARRATTGTWCRGSATPTTTSFHAARGALAELHDRLWEETGVGPERTVLGGFSMGVGDELRDGARRRPPGGRRDPRLQRLRADGRRTGSRRFDDRAGDPRLHRPRPPRPDHGGRASAGAPATCSRRAGWTVEYRESDVGHQIDPGAPGRRDRLAGGDAAAPEALFGVRARRGRWEWPAGRSELLFEEGLRSSRARRDAQLRR